MDRNLNTQHEAKIAEITERKKSLEKDLQAKNKEIEDYMAMNDARFDQRMQEYREKEKSLLENLSVSTKDQLKERFAFEERIKVWKTIGLLLTILYFAAVCYAVFFLKVDLYVRKMIAYPLLVIIGVVFHKLFVKITCARSNYRIAKINEIPAVQNYDGARRNNLKKYDRAHKDEEQISIRLKKEAADIQAQIAQQDVLLQELLAEQEERLFNETYADGMFFLGTDTYYTYEIYIDGLFYQQTKANKLCAIRFNPGIHTFRLETVVYNGRRYRFEPFQMMIGEKQESFIYICNGDKVWRASSRELQEALK